MSFALVMLVINYFQRQELTRLRNEPKIEVFTGGDIEKGKVIDSLQGEIFILNTTIGRYELTLEHLYEVNPKAAKQFDEFLQHETE
jgi:hypothetical protein